MAKYQVTIHLKIYRVTNIFTFSLIIHLQNCMSYGSSLSPSGNVTPKNKYTHCINNITYIVTNTTTPGKQ